MLEWLTGSTRTVNAQDAPTADGLSYVEEPPETPAPLFAVRAFKTAIFGTPHPHQSDVKHHTRSVEQNTNDAKTHPAEEAAGVQAHIAVAGHSDEILAVVKPGPLVSPTKGILLTPGTGATRRKTVSFGTLMADAQQKDERLLATEMSRDSPTKSKNEPEIPKTSPRIQPRHSSLTRTLIQMSKQKPSDQATLAPLFESNEERPTNETMLSTGVQTQNSDQTPENTVDLSQPRSRSGQHWKTEYEQYHKRSNLEMKKMIVYGQNVKSYAVKKDSEATCLGEKLKKELAKVVAMEKKVSKLAAQLNTSYAHGPEEESEQTRLVSELAQQTALAIRYKQKADRYRRAMQKGNRADGSDGEGDKIHVSEEASQMSDREAHPPTVAARSAEQGTLHAELQSLRMSAKQAEDQAAKLEAENSALKQSLARVKGEMMSYEARRQAREERYKRREAKCKADQKACEAQLAKLTVEHRNLLLAAGQSSNPEPQTHPQSTAPYNSVRRHGEDAKSLEKPLVDGDKTNPEPRAQDRLSRPYTSPRKNRSQKSPVDIWTLSSPRETIDGVQSSKEPTELPPSSVRHDIHRTLKEIDQNLIPEQHLGTESNLEAHASKTDTSHTTPTNTVSQPQPDTSSSPVDHTYNQKPSISSQRLANADPASHPTRPDPSDAVVRPTVTKSIATLGRSSSLMSTRAGGRTGTMASVGRGAALSAERAAAAKARLAARSAEKRRGLDGRK